MFSISHDRDIAPLDGEPVGQTEHRDGGAVGPAGIQLEYNGDQSVFTGRGGEEVQLQHTFTLRGAMY